MLEGHLRENAGRYFPELPPGEVSVAPEACRRSRLSTTHFLRLDIGGATRRVVVKLPPADGAPPIASSRARVAPVMDAAHKFEREALTLERMADHFEKRGDPRFGAVRLLDFVKDLDAVVMERIPEPTLRELLLPPRLLRGQSRDLAPAFAHLGSWLRCYQGIEGLSHSEARHPGRRDFVETVRGLCAFGGRAWLAKVGERVAEAAALELPERLPLGVAHGDFAPRNVLVSDADRVTVLDTRAAWRAPVLEDVGYLVASLWTSRAQAVGLAAAQPRETLARYEAAFLTAYFGEQPVALAAVRLFEIQALLDRYASLEEKRRESSGFSPRGSARHWVLERCLRRRIRELASDLPGGAA